MKKFHLAMVVILAASWLACGDAAAATGLKDLGKAPDFELETWKGGRTSLGEMLGNGPVIIDFWATWCGPCQRAMPHIQDLYERYRERGLTVLAISQDDPRSQSQIGPFVSALELTFPVLLDDAKKAARLYRVSSIPTTFLISPDGRVVAMHRGFRPGDEKLLAAEIDALFVSLADGAEE